MKILVETTKSDIFDRILVWTEDNDLTTRYASNGQAHQFLITIPSKKWLTMFYLTFPSDIVIK